MRVACLLDYGEIKLKDFRLTKNIENTKLETVILALLAVSSNRIKLGWMLTHPTFSHLSHQI